MREAVFNILDHRTAGTRAGLDGARVLDAFAGTGALGLEALSRGAGHATLMDSAAAAIAACHSNARTLGESGRVTVLRADCLHPLTADRAVDVAFLDPPYRQGLAAPALAALTEAGWIATGTLCVVQTGAAEGFEDPGGCDTLDDRRYGATRIRILLRR